MAPTYNTNVFSSQFSVVKYQFDVAGFFDFETEFDTVLNLCVYVSHWIVSNIYKRSEGDKPTAMRHLFMALKHHCSVIDAFAFVWLVVVW